MNCLSYAYATSSYSILTAHHCRVRAVDGVVARAHEATTTFHARVRTEPREVAPVGVVLVAHGETPEVNLNKLVIF